MDYTNQRPNTEGKEGPTTSPHNSQPSASHPSPDDLHGDEIDAVNAVFVDEITGNGIGEDNFNDSNNIHSQDTLSKDQDASNDCCRLFIGQIPPGGGKELYNRMSTFGEIVEFVILKNREDQSHTGAGFCIFKDPVAARNAKHALHDKVMLPGAHQKLVVKLSKRERHVPLTDFTKLFVGNIPPGVEEFQLRYLFSAYGNVRECSIIYYSDNGQRRSRGYGFVEISSTGGKEAIKNLHNQKPFPSSIKGLIVKESEEPKLKLRSIDGKSKKGYSSNSMRNYPNCPGGSHGMDQSYPNGPLYVDAHYSDGVGTSNSPMSQTPTSSSYHLAHGNSMPMSALTGCAPAHPLTPRGQNNDYSPRHGNNGVYNHTNPLSAHGSTHSPRTHTQGMGGNASASNNHMYVSTSGHYVSPNGQYGPNAHHVTNGSGGMGTGVNGAGQSHANLHSHGPMIYHNGVPSPRGMGMGFHGPHSPSSQNMSGGFVAYNNGQNYTYQGNGGCVPSNAPYQSNTSGFPGNSNGYQGCNTPRNYHGNPMASFSSSASPYPSSVHGSTHGRDNDIMVSTTPILPHAHLPVSSSGGLMGLNGADKQRDGMGGVATPTLSHTSIAASVIGMNGLNANSGAHTPTLSHHSLSLGQSGNSNYHPYSAHHPSTGMQGYSSTNVNASPRTHGAGAASGPYVNMNGQSMMMNNQGMLQSTGSHGTLPHGHAYVQAGMGASIAGPPTSYQVIGPLASLSSSPPPLSPALTATNASTTSDVQGNNLGAGGASMQQNSVQLPPHLLSYSHSTNGGSYPGTPTISHNGTPPHVLRDVNGSSQSMRIGGTGLGNAKSPSPGYTNYTIAPRNRGFSCDVIDIEHDDAIYTNEATDPSMEHVDQLSGITAPGIRQQNTAEYHNSAQTTPLGPSEARLQPLPLSNFASGDSVRSKHGNNTYGDSGEDMSGRGGKREERDGILPSLATPALSLCSAATTSANFSNLVTHVANSTSHSLASSPAPSHVLTTASVPSGLMHHPHNTLSLLPLASVHGGDSSMGNHHVHGMYKVMHAAMSPTNTSTTSISTYGSVQSDAAAFGFNRDHEMGPNHLHGINLPSGHAARGENAFNSAYTYGNAAGPNVSAMSKSLRGFPSGDGSHAFGPAGFNHGVRESAPSILASGRDTTEASTPTATASMRMPTGSDGDRDRDRDSGCFAMVRNTRDVRERVSGNGVATLGIGESSVFSFGVNNGENSSINSGMGANIKSGSLLPHSSGETTLFSPSNGGYNTTNHTEGTPFNLSNTLINNSVQNIGVNPVFPANTTNNSHSGPRMDTNTNGMSSWHANNGWNTNLTNTNVNVAMPHNIHNNNISHMHVNGHNSSNMSSNIGNHNGMSLNNHVTNTNTHMSMNPGMSVGVGQAWGRDGRDALDYMGQHHTLFNSHGNMGMNGMQIHGMGMNMNIGPGTGNTMYSSHGMLSSSPGTNLVQSMQGLSLHGHNTHNHAYNNTNYAKSCTNDPNAHAHAPHYTSNTSARGLAYPIDEKDDYEQYSTNDVAAL